MPSLRHACRISLAYCLRGSVLCLSAVALLRMGPSAGAAQDAAGPELRHGKFSLSEADRAWWAFQPVRKPTLPSLDSKPGTMPIDLLVRASLTSSGLAPNPPASRRVLIRRAYFDVIGLPPTPEGVEAFVHDNSSGAWERVVDTLLASPHHGERWARHWMDLVRFAESNGYERDGEKPNAWRYRDYVIESFNRDKPYDQFIREQLAGDQIADEILAAGAPQGEAWKSMIIATGFYRLHVWDDEPDNTQVAEFDDLDDIVVTTSTAFLGVTLGCARCHDHKFDPFSQADYYSMLAFLRNIDPYGQHHTGGGGRGTGKITRALALPEALARWEAEKASTVRTLESRLAKADEAGRKSLEEELKKARDARPPFDMALAIAELTGKPKPTHVLLRGRVDSPGDEVKPAFPAVFNVHAAPRPAGEAASNKALRRQMADWIASPSNPLTARVMANRVWQHYFGVGIVPTPDDFGRTGIKPTHPALLDYLASRLVEQGWSLKRLHREILLSETYQQSSASTRRQALQIDEGNRLLWRQNLRRVESEVIRDSYLAISGQLNRKQGGPSVFPTLPKEIHITQDSAGKGWGESSVEEQNRRSVYLFVKRALKVPMLEAFDFANCTAPMGQRPVTTIAPQALMALNDAFAQRQSEAFAARVLREAGAKEDAQIHRAFALAFQREPSRAEQRSALQFLKRQTKQAGVDGIAEPGRVALTSLCLSLLNANETVYAE